MSMIDEQAAEWMVRQSEGVLDADQLSAFDAWYAADIRHQGAYLRAVAFQRILVRAAGNPALQLAPHSPTAVGVSAGRRTWLAYGGIAAGVVLSVGAAMLLNRGEHASFVTTRGERRSVGLQDQSQLALNGGSHVDVELRQDLRKVSLIKGEAWFAVAKDPARPFIVEAGGVKVRALGTAFGVRRDGNGAEVAVTEGIVEVWHPLQAGRRQLLSAGELLLVDERARQVRLVRDPAEVERKLAWKDGKLVFRKQALEEAVAEFNRYNPRQLRIADPALNSLPVFGQYPVDAPEQFARDVSAYLNVPLVIGADVIVIGRSAAPRKDSARGGGSSL